VFGPGIGGGPEICRRNTRTGLGDRPSIKAKLVGDSVKKIPEKPEPVGYRGTSHAQNQQSYHNLSFHFRTLVSFSFPDSYALAAISAIHGNRPVPVLRRPLPLIRSPDLGRHWRRTSRSRTRRRRHARRRGTVTQVVRRNTARICRGIAEKIPRSLFFEGHEACIQWGPLDTLRPACISSNSHDRHNGHERHEN